MILSENSKRQLEEKLKKLEGEVQDYFQFEMEDIEPALFFFNGSKTPRPSSPVTYKFKDITGLCEKETLLEFADQIDEIKYIRKLLKSNV